MKHLLRLRTKVGTGGIRANNKEIKFVKILIPNIHNS